MRFDKNEINIEIKKKDAKSINAYDTSKILKNYLALQNKMNENLQDMNMHEMGLFCKSMHKWLRDKNKINELNEKISVGDICMIDWSVNYKPELSYYHPAIVLEEVNNMFLVVPTSSKPQSISKAYHPQDNPKGKWYWRKVNKNDGFSEECLVLLDNLKVISKTRIMCKMGRLSCELTDEDGLFRELRRSIIKNMFKGEYKKYKSLLENDEEISRLKEEIEQLKKQNELLIKQRDEEKNC